MKKRLITFVLILTCGLALVPQANAFRSRYADFWAQLFGHHFSNQKNPAKKSASPRFNTLTRRYPTRTRLSSRFHNRRSLLFSRDFRNRYNINRQNNAMGLVATISPTTPNQSIYKVTDDPVSVFKIGVRNNSHTSSTKFPANFLLDKAEFQLFSRNGIFTDPSDFDLVVNGESFQFDKNGKATISFNNARLAEGESLELDVAIKADDPDNMLHQNGSAKLRLLNISAEKEFSRDFVPVLVSGNRISKLISYLPTPVVSSGGNSTIVSTTGSSIYGDLILAGEEKFVLAVHMNASYDDLAIRKMTVHNVYGNLIDSQVQEIQAINLLTGELLDTAMFTNGEARFQFSPRVIIPRNSSGKIGFKVKIRENPRNHGDRRLKLTLSANDVLVESMSNGRELPNSHKNFNIDSYDFVVVRSSLEISPQNQPNNFPIGTGSPEGVYNFAINSRDSAELARISFDVYPNGLQFAGGSISSNDFELVEVYGNHEENLNINISVSGNKVTFDFVNPLSFFQNSAKNFRLKVALDELGASNDNDGVSVLISTGDIYINNSLATVRGTGANFIWSDESASPHSTNSDDWFSGYRMNFPSNSVYIKR